MPAARGFMLAIVLGADLAGDRRWPDIFRLVTWIANNSLVCAVDFAKVRIYIAD